MEGKQWAVGFELWPVGRSSPTLALAGGWKEFENAKARMKNERSEIVCPYS
jgi:hypothetical protein